VITLREGTVPPSGYTFVGRTVVIVKRPNGQIVPMTLDVYQKN